MISKYLIIGLIFLNVSAIAASEGGAGGSDHIEAPFRRSRIGFMDMIREDNLNAMLIQYMTFGVQFGITREDPRRDDIPTYETYLERQNELVREGPQEIIMRGRTISINPKHYPVKDMRIRFILDQLRADRRRDLNKAEEVRRYLLGHGFTVTDAELNLWLEFDRLSLRQFGSRGNWLTDPIDPAPFRPLIAAYWAEKPEQRYSRRKAAIIGAAMG